MQNNLLSLARPEIVAMSGYRSARSLALKGNVWLDANENPWSDTHYNRYPEPQPERLLTRLSEIYSVNRDQILITRGSDEGIDLLIRLFCTAGQDHIMICPPTYGMYKVAATIQGARSVEIPLLKKNNFALDVESVVKAWQPSIKLIFLCSPNNPTGNLLNVDAIKALCETLKDKAIVVVDEAYIEFSQQQSMCQSMKELPNLIVLRTLSKAYGLAGIRCGATIANSDIIKVLKKMIAPYPISKPVADIACQRLNAFRLDKQIKTILQEKDKLTDFFAKAPYVVKVWESSANFILMEVLDATRIMKLCLAAGIVLRDRSTEYELENCVRVTIGTPSENKLLMEVIRHA